MKGYKFKAYNNHTKEVWKFTLEEAMGWDKGEGLYEDQWDIVESINLRDKKNIEAYRGDIVRLRHSNGTIQEEPIVLGEFDDGENMCNLQCYMAGGYPLLDNGEFYGAIANNTWEIVGNINETKDK